MGAAPTGSFGHTGFTGPAMIVVPERRMSAVVLSNRVYPRRRAFEHHPVTAAILDAAYRIHSPLTHAPRVARERLCIIAARGDRIVPHEHSRWLETHWNHPRTIWFTGSHLAPFGRATVRREIRRFLQDLDVL